MPAYSELKRRLGFEYNGMVLHDYYFSNLKKDGGEDPAPIGLLLYVLADKEPRPGEHESFIKPLWKQGVECQK